MTILIVGGMAQGKRAFARSLSPEAEIVDNLQDIVRRALERGAPVPQAADFLDKTVVCTELGCGVVPMDAFEREWREQTGRLCCEIAAQAARVYRVSCGIAQCIKGAP
ncbi:MAG TPA: bifunctional adenosylcobinamide kinase/adenosylcobinamide-phosphate guanylyltransferase [Candidatus Butyricicoccus stercorigallinarum]|nr:bifunctional adenosylcobinamide kinase/adenosylcobinamide-phosphate guanylyltransferase [Candidatus Butyricicoccus stercorigallinarum]